VEVVAWLSNEKQNPKSPIASKMSPQRQHGAGSVFDTKSKAKPMMMIFSNIATIELTISKEANKRPTTNNLLLFESLRKIAS